MMLRIKALRGIFGMFADLFARPDILHQTIVFWLAIKCEVKSWTKLFSVWLDALLYRLPISTLSYVLASCIRRNQEATA